MPAPMPSNPNPSNPHGAQPYLASSQYPSAANAPTVTANCRPRFRYRKGLDSSFPCSSSFPVSHPPRGCSPDARNRAMLSPAAALLNRLEARSEKKQNPCRRTRDHHVRERGASNTRWKRSSFSLGGGRCQAESGGAEKEAEGDGDKEVQPAGCRAPMPGKASQPHQFR